MLSRGSPRLQAKAAAAKVEKNPAAVAKEALAAAPRFETSPDVVKLFIKTCEFARASSSVFLYPGELLNVVENFIRHPHGELFVRTHENPAVRAQLLALCNYAREKDAVPEDPSFFDDMRA